MKWTKEQQERFEKFILGDDMDFYEEYTIHLTDEEQEKFFEENPEFMSVYPISRDMIHLLRDPMYRGLMKKIKKYETGEREKYWLHSDAVAEEADVVLKLDHGKIVESLKSGMQILEGNIEEPEIIEP